MWYSVPQPADADRKASQRWHRDFNDKHLLKAFLYLVDVDEGTGPFEYVPGSAPGGQYADEWPWRPLGENYPPDGELEKRIPDDGIRTFTAPKGTMVFCNTSGFHRGGFATERPRVLATVTYSSPASLKSLTERSYRFTGRSTSSTRRRGSRSPEQRAREDRRLPRRVSSPASRGRSVDDPAPDPSDPRARGGSRSRQGRAIRTAARFDEAGWRDPGPLRRPTVGSAPRSR
jgi:hypothetical protein